MGKLEAKAAIITGGGRGLGLILASDNAVAMDAVMAGMRGSKRDG
jgi:hypothetical protein